ncbi:MAG: RdgB/HAM1 family non-canonical purine NTP pyrophosphatase [Planctomycetes bacterium]|nr:RdgB/HAM1 family non-canonical purine NTP pyrophosphatase [Planctomycetota bacterium]
MAEFSKILIATNNAHKIEEIRAILAGTGIEIVSPRELGVEVDPEETASTFKGNAIIKASEFSLAAGIPAFADDSGLCVDALEGAPGVYSSRYAFEGCTFEDNNNKLLDALKDVPEGKRNAKFVCVISLCDGRNLLSDFRGELSGSIAISPKGDNGFGYDPVFVPDFDKMRSRNTRTLAEMTKKEKNSISHRSNALKMFASYLRNQLHS